MIVIRLELWPHGNAARARSLGVIEIANIGGTATRGDYAVRLTKTPGLARRGGDWKRGAVRGFPRQRLGAYDLLLRALANVIGDRNPDAHAAVDRRLGEIEAEVEAEPARLADLLARVAR